MKKMNNRGSRERLWKESSPVIHFSIVYVAPSPAIQKMFIFDPFFQRKIFSTHKSNIVRDKKLGKMSPQAKHFISVIPEYSRIALEKNFVLSPFKSTNQ